MHLDRNNVSKIDTKSLWKKILKTFQASHIAYMSAQLELSLGSIVTITSKITIVLLVVKDILLQYANKLDKIHARPKSSSWCKYHWR